VRRRALVLLTREEARAFVEGPSFETPRVRCPWCASVLDRSSSTVRDEREPGPGDMTVCLHCAGVCLWLDLEGVRSLVKVTPEMRERLSAEDRARLERAQKTIVNFLGSRGAGVT
jgi:hypothetical protein